MPEAIIADVDTTAIELHAKEPILSKSSDLFGEVTVYAPNTDPSEWADKSWLLKTEFNAQKEKPGIEEFLRADQVWEAFVRPYFIDNRHRFVPSP